MTETSPSEKKLQECKNSVANFGSGKIVYKNNKKRQRNVIIPLKLKI